MKNGYMKYCCFLCTWDSKARYQHYNDEVWLAQEMLYPGKMNIAQTSLIDLLKIFLPGLHIKLGGIVQNFIKTLNTSGEAGIFFLKNKFSKLSKANIREGVFDGQDIRQLMLVCDFKKSLTELER